MIDLSPLEAVRAKESPQLPKALLHLESIDFRPGTSDARQIQTAIQQHFPLTYGQPYLQINPLKEKIKTAPLRVGVVLSGGQAPGGHNVIAGLHDALQVLCRDSMLWGFLKGPSGIVENKTKLLDAAALIAYRNQGGFDLLGSGRTKIETAQQLQAALDTVTSLKLDGLVIIGGDDSNTNAAVLAEFFKKRGSSTRVIGVPKTIDGDLRHPLVEVSFGFDTACKVYSEMIGNIARDCLSSKKYTHFIKLMGRSASHIALECALKTRPNVALIGEEIAAQGATLADVAASISDVICARAEQGKHYGIVLMPEGLIEFLPDVGALIRELNYATASKGALEAVKSLSAPSKKCFDAMPVAIQQQLLLDRDPHGNVQVAQIATEQLLMEMVASDLKKRASTGAWGGKFQPLCHYFGYEGRCSLPSHFDSNYCYALGAGAALLVARGFTGYMISVQNLKQPVEEWTLSGIPITSMMVIEQRMGKDKPVIQKALVDISGPLFKKFVDMRQRWALEDAFCSPGPIQFWGDREITHSVPLTM